jgi:hypothetical protein
MTTPPAGSLTTDGPADRIRVRLAAPIAFLASCLGVVCVVSVPDVVSTLQDLSLVDSRFVGWAGVGEAIGVMAAATALVGVGRFGSGPPLSLGAAAAVFGLALAAQVIDPFQLSLSLMLLAGAAACLLAGGASMTFELPRRPRRLVMAAWALPIVSAWPLLAWFSGHVGRLAVDDAPRLTAHPSVWLLAPASAFIVVWSALSMLIEPVRAGVRSGPAWDAAWYALLSTALGACLAIMALGFDPSLPPGWLRPLVLFVSGVVIISLGAVTMLLPDAQTRVGYAGLVFVMVFFPITVQLIIIVTDDGSSRVAWWTATALSLATALGAVVGGWRPRWMPLALIVVAAGCAGSWIMPDSQGWMAAGALPLCLGAGAVFGAGIRDTADTAVGWRFGAMAVVSITLLGTVIGIALSWALGGDIPDDVNAARAAGRVFLGVMFAFAVLAAAVVSVLSPRPVAEQPTDGPARADSSV